MRLGRLVLALVAAAIVGTLPSTIIAVAAMGAETYYVSPFLGGWVAASIAAFLVSVTIGLAWHFVAMPRNWRGALHYAGAGALVGVVLVLAANVSVGPDNFNTAAVAINGPLGILTGGLVAFVFWLIRRPDRDAHA